MKKEYLRLNTFNMGSDQNFKGFYAENKALLKEYVDLRVNLVKLQAVKVLSKSFGLVIVIFLVGFMSLFTLVFLGMSFAWWLTNLTGSAVLGFAGAAGLFFMLLLLVIVFRRPLVQNPLIRLFIRETSKDLHQND